MYNVRLMYVTCLLYNRTIQSIWAHTHWNRRNRYHTIIRPHIQRWNSYKFEDLFLFISLPLLLHLPWLDFPCLVLLKHLNSAVFIWSEMNEHMCELKHVRVHVRCTLKGHKSKPSTDNREPWCDSHEIDWVSEVTSHTTSRYSSSTLIAQLQSESLSNKQCFVFSLSIPKYLINSDSREDVRIGDRATAEWRILSKRMWVSVQIARHNFQALLLLRLHANGNQRVKITSVERIAKDPYQTEFPFNLRNHISM